MMVGIVSISQKGERIMIKLEEAIERCFWRCNKQDESTCDIDYYMNMYKAIRELSSEEYEKVYYEICRRLGYGINYKF